MAEAILFLAKITNAGIRARRCGMSIMQLVIWSLIQTILSIAIFWLLFILIKPNRREMDGMKDEIGFGMKLARKAREKEDFRFKELEKRLDSIEKMCNDVSEAWKAVCERLDAQGARLQELEARCRIAYPIIPAENSLDKEADD